MRIVFIFILAAAVVVVAAGTGTAQSFGLGYLGFALLGGGPGAVLGFGPLGRGSRVDSSPTGLDVAPVAADLGVAGRAPAWAVGSIVGRGSSLGFSAPTESSVFGSDPAIADRPLGPSGF